MKKRILALMCAGVMAFSLCACGGEKEGKEKKEKTEESSEKNEDKEKEKEKEKDKEKTEEASGTESEEITEEAIEEEEYAEVMEETYVLDEDEVYEDSDIENVDDSGDTYILGSTDWESYEVEIDGNLYVLPCDFSEFEANGWEIDSSFTSDTVAVDDYIFTFVEKDGTDMIIMMGNKYDSNEINVADGQVVGIVFDYNIGDMPANIAGDIALGSSYEDVINAFGTPDYEYGDEGDKSITYESATYSQDSLTYLEIYFEEGIVVQIDIVNW